MHPLTVMYIITYISYNYKIKLLISLDKRWEKAPGELYIELQPFSKINDYWLYLRVSMKVFFFTIIIPGTDINTEKRPS